MALNAGSVGAILQSLPHVTASRCVKFHVMFRLLETFLFLLIVQNMHLARLVPTITCILTSIYTSIAMQIYEPKDEFYNITKFETL